MDSGYRPVPCGIPQGFRISECEGAWEFPDSRISGYRKRVTSREKERMSETRGMGNNSNGDSNLNSSDLGTGYKYL